MYRESGREGGGHEAVALMMNLYFILRAGWFAKYELWLLLVAVVAALGSTAAPLFSVRFQFKLLNTVWMDN